MTKNLRKRGDLVNPPLCVGVVLKEAGGTGSSGAKRGVAMPGLLLPVLARTVDFSIGNPYINGT
jgi:hypothetical protein